MKNYLIVLIFVLFQYQSKSQITYQNFHTDNDVQFNSISKTSNFTVGSIIGTTSVSEIGAANFNTSIDVPEGPGGVLPSISISYNSNSKSSSIVGRGFNLAYGSAISLVVKTDYHDNDLINGSNASRSNYSLDGNVLYPYNSSVNGGNGAQYKSAVENYSKITSHHSSSTSNAPDYFRVETKAGFVTFYGKSTLSKLQDGNAVRVISWLASKTVDRFGNFIEYNYESVNGEHRIKNISYGGNELNGTSHPYKVNFLYQDRIYKGYSTNLFNKFYQNSLLQSIQVLNNGVVSHNYELSYAKDDLDSYLITIQKHGENGEKYNPTRFKYAPTSQINGGAFLEGQFSPIDEELRYGDVNGDGHTDIIKLNKTFYNGAGGWYSGYQSLQIFVWNPILNDYTFSTERTILGGQSFSLSQLLATKSIKIADIDSDGRDEVILSRFTPDLTFLSIEIIELNDYGQSFIKNVDFGPVAGKRLAENADPFYLLDVNNDGTSEIIVNVAEDPGSLGELYALDYVNDLIYPGITTGAQNPESLLMHKYLSFIDTDSDGKSEIVSHRGDINNIFEWSFGGGVWKISLDGSPFSTIGAFDDSRGLKFLSTNTDATLDLLFKRESPLPNQIYLGYGPDEFIPAYGMDYNVSRNAYFSDINSDGISDEIYLFTTSNNLTNIAVSFGRRKLYEQNNGLSQKKYYIFDGNGNFQNISTLSHDVNLNPILNSQIPDYSNSVNISVLKNGGRKSSLVITYTPEFNNPTLPNRRIKLNFDMDKTLQKIRDGLGNTSEIFFSELSSNLIYTRNIENNIDVSKNNPNYPYRILRKGLNVVSKIKTSFIVNNLPSFYDKDFSYEDLVVHYKAGLMGFKESQEINRLNSLKNITFKKIYKNNNSVNARLSFNIYKSESYKLVSSGERILSRSTIEYDNRYRNYIGYHSSNLRSRITKEQYQSRIITTDFLKGGTKEIINTFDSPVAALSHSTGNLKLRTSKIWQSASYDKDGNLLNLSGLLQTDSELNEFEKHGTWIPSSITKIIETSIYHNHAHNVSNQIETRFAYYLNGVKAGLVKNKTNYYNNFTLKNTDHFEYDNLGRLINKKKTAPSIAGNFNQVNYTHDNLGNVLTETNALGYKNTFVYFQTGSKGGKIYKEIDVNGQPTTYNYGDFGELNYISDQSGSENLIKTWDNTSTTAGYKIENIFSTKANETSFYDYLGRIVKKSTQGINNLDSKVIFGYDNNGYLFNESIPAKDGDPLIYSEYSYDDFGRVIKKNFNAGGTVSDLRDVEFDYNVDFSLGLRTLTKIEKNKKIIESYDFSNKLISVLNSDINDDNAINIEHEYDKMGRLFKTFSNTLSGESILMRKRLYNLRGVLIEQDDKSLGEESFGYNAIGRLISETNANGQTKILNYDQMGRVIETINPDFTTTIISYNNAAGINRGTLNFKLLNTTGTSSQIHGEFYHYLGNNGLPSSKTVNIKGSNTLSSDEFTIYYTYDPYGRIKTDEQGGLIQEFIYDSGSGELVRINDFSTGDMIWSVQTKNAFGQITEYSRINTGTTIKSYDIIGKQTWVTTGNHFSMRFNYGGNENLTSKTDFTNYGTSYSMQEFFKYSGGSMDKLLESHVKRRTNSGYCGSLEPVQNFEYNNDGLGNISSLTSTGQLNYVEMSSYDDLVDNPHQLKSVNQSGITDPFVNKLLEQETEYTYFNKPKNVRASNENYIEFTHGFNNKRVMSKFYSSWNDDTNVGTLDEKRIYVTGNYEIIFKDGNRYDVVYIGTGSGTEVIYSRKNQVLNSSSFYSTHMDYQGSILNITKGVSNQLVLKQNFDAWGRDRNPNTWTYNNLHNSTWSWGQGCSAPGAPDDFVYLDPNLNIVSDDIQHWFRRGYTGHEMLPEVGLIHMNARLYDPHTGRMLSPDPFILDANNSQAYNRYTYALNNPTKYMDPSGEFIISAMITGAIIGALVSGATYGLTVAVTGQSWDWGDFGKTVAFGAIGGALGGGIGAIGSKIGGIGQSLGYNILSNVASNSATTLAFGGNISAGGLTGMVLGGIIGHGIGNFNGIKGGSFANIVAEISFRSVKGAIAGGFGGAYGAAIDGQDALKGFKNGAKYGAIAGAATSGLNILTMGASYIPEKKYGDFGRSKPLYRRGHFLWPKSAGITLGRNLVTRLTGNQTYDEHLIAHETAHYFQQMKLGFGEFYKRTIKEYLKVGQHNTYDQGGTLEFGAQIYSLQQIGYFWSHKHEQYINNSSYSRFYQDTPQKIY